VNWSGHDLDVHTSLDGGVGGDEAAPAGVRLDHDDQPA
jgi:hypothetical protein